MIGIYIYLEQRNAMTQRRQNAFSRSEALNFNLCTRKEIQRKKKRKALL